MSTFSSSSSSSSSLIVTRISMGFLIILLIIVLISTSTSSRIGGGSNPFFVEASSDGDDSATGGPVGPSQLFSRNSSSALVELTSFEQISNNLVRDRYRASVVVFYDSADLNSWRVRRFVEEGASSLAGFCQVFAADVRNPVVSMLVSAWSVSAVPWVYGIGPRQIKPRSEFGQSPGISLVGGLRTPIPRASHYAEVTPASVRKFGLALVADSDLVIKKIESQQQLQSLEKSLNQEKLADATTTSVVLLTDKAASSLLYRALAASFAQRANFYEINTKKVPSALKSFDVKKVPALFVYPEKKKYEGPLNILPLEKFISEFVPISREDHEAALRLKHEGALKREIRRRQSPLLEIQTSDDWIEEVDQRAGVVGVAVVQGGSEGEEEEEEETNARMVEKAVRELREEETAKKRRSNVVQFVYFKKSKFAALSESLEKQISASSSSSTSSSDATTAAKIFFISSRKSFGSRFIGAISGSGLQGFMKSELKRGVGAKEIDLGALKNAAAEQKK